MAGVGRVRTAPAPLLTSEWRAALRPSDTSVEVSYARRSGRHQAVEEEPGIGSGPASTMASGDLEGDLEALHPAAFCWALRCCGGDRDAAEETVQATYLKIVSGRARFAGRSSFKTWLFGVVRKTASEERRRWRLRALALGFLARRPAAEPVRSAADPAARPAAVQRLRHALARLSRRQQQILHLVFYDDLTIEEAAAAAGVSVGTARTHYERGKQALRRHLGEERP